MRSLFIHSLLFLNPVSPASSIAETVLVSLWLCWFQFGFVLVRYHQLVSVLLYVWAVCSVPLDLFVSLIPRGFAYSSKLVRPLGTINQHYYLQSSCSRLVLLNCKRDSYNILSVYNFAFMAILSCKWLHAPHRPWLGGPFLVSEGGQVSGRFPSNSGSFPSKLSKVFSICSL